MADNFNIIRFKFLTFSRQGFEKSELLSFQTLFISFFLSGSKNQIF